MKKLLLILLCLPMIGFGQLTYVPDDNFEQELINLGYDKILDDYVTTATIDTLKILVVRGKRISDLTGIEDFTSLQILFCTVNNLTGLDVSQNTALTTLYCSMNQLTSLDVSQNTALSELQCIGNNLTSLDLSQNTDLFLLFCGLNNLTSLDISANKNLERLDCYNNKLRSLDIRNGNNSNFSHLEYKENPNLNCINVDDAVWSTANWTKVDPQQYFSSSCP